jgi:hypothetical protein
MQTLFRVDSLQFVLKLSFEISEGLVEKLEDVSFSRGEFVLDDGLHALHLSDDVGLCYSQTTLRFLSCSRLSMLL